MSSNLAYKLRKLREYFGVTHAEIAEELREHDLSGLKLTAEMIREFEAGTQQPSDAVLLAYSKVSHFPVESLTNDEVKPFFEQSN